MRGLVVLPRLAQPRDDAVASGGVSDPTDACASAISARMSSYATSAPADGCEIALPLSKCGCPFAGSRSGCGTATAVNPKKTLAIARAVAVENASSVRLCLTAEFPPQNSRQLQGEYAASTRADAATRIMRTREAVVTPSDPELER